MMKLLPDWPGWLPRSLDHTEPLEIDEGREGLLWSFYFDRLLKPITWERWFRNEPSVLHGINFWLDHIRRWLEPFDAVWCSWEPPCLYVSFKSDDREKTAYRLAYRWLKTVNEVEPPDGAHRAIRVGASAAPCYLLINREGHILDVVGTGRNRVYVLATRASHDGVWVDRDYYDLVYRVLPGRSFPPARVPLNKESIPLFKLEWGLPGRYLLEPPEGEE